MIVTTSSRADIDAMNLELHCLNLLPLYAAFNSTDATLVLCVPSDFARFRVIGVCWAGTPASDENIGVDESVHTIGSDGVHSATKTGNVYTIQLKRTGASKTAGLGVFVTLAGLP